jgi:parvulin-like peptidyl-prolyl isomerase
MAETEKLEQVSPTKEQLAVSRTLILGQALMNSELNTLEIGPGEVAKYYEAHKEQYKQVRVKAIYLAFGDSAAAGKQSRTEAQARDEAARLLAQIRAGADFVKLVKERSDDQTSREKDGDFATFRKKENIPDAIAAAVFALKQGEVSEPIRQPSGYYLLRAEEVSYVPQSQAESDIILAIRGQQYGQWLEQNTADAKVQFPNPAFPAGAAAAPAGK